MTNGLDLFYDLTEEFRESVLGTYAGRNPATVWQHARQGSIKLLDALVLRDELRAARPSRILEIGSFLGYSTRWILENSQEFDSRVTAVDPQVVHRIFDDLDSHVRAFCSPHGHRLTQKRGFLSEANYNLILAAILRENHWQGDAVEILRALKAIDVIDAPFAEFDFAFVDGDHSRRATILNVALVAAMVVPGGTIVVHDAISWTDVAPALEALSEASDGRIELRSIAGLTYRERMLPLYASRMTPENAAFSCNAVNDGLGLLTVHETLGDFEAVAARALAAR